MAECKKNGVAYVELPIAFDALTVVVNKNNNWINTITVQELKNMWQVSAEDNITSWNQINNTWPDVPLNLFAPGQNSGTHEYFNVAILGEGQISRNDYVASENDQVLVDGVSQDPNSLGYFGYAYYQQNQDKLKALKIDNGNGGVFPMDETIKNNSYLPLTRPLFIYVNAQKAQQNKKLTKFVNFYLNQAENAAEQVGYLPLPSSGYKLAQIRFQENRVGTVFNGSPILNASITELLKKTYASETGEGYVY
jgi:phosphate transport system substrate-binding protein